MLALVVAITMLAAQPEPRQALGRVTDATGGTLPGASVLTVCGQWRHTAVADAAGEFRVDGVPPERCLVVASLDGFLASRQTADFSRPSPARLDFRLRVRPFQADVVVTPTRFAEDAVFVPQAVSVVDRADLDARPYTIVTQALKEEAGVMAQQTTAAQGSPILRGFTGQRNLYLLDGVRFNTAAWRDGPSQYVAWVPGADLDHIEIVRGPASAQYGSDAIGGTVALFSAGPGTTARWSALGSFGYGSANGLRTTDVTAGGQRDRLWFAATAAFADVNDLRAGGGEDSRAAVTRYLGLPSRTLGDRLSGTGYTQTAASARARVDLGPGRALTLSYRHGQQDSAHRYDQEMGGNGRYRSEFGPQAFDLAFARFETASWRWLDAASATISLNRQDDGRLEQQRPGARIDEQTTTTTALGYQAQGVRAFGSRSSAVFGAEWYDERIGGARTLTEPSGAVVASRPDIPDGTRYGSLGVYWQQGVDLAAGRLHLRGGVRHGRFRFSTVADPALGVADERITQSDTTFNTGLVATLSRALSATVSVSRGFRAANAYDFGGIGISGGAGFEVAPARVAALGGLRGTTDGATAVSSGTPIGALGPERVLAYEAGLRWNSERASAMLTVFNLDFRDAIERRTVIFPDTIVGREIAGHVIVRQDSAGRAYIQADARPMVTRVNVSRSRIRGFEAEVSARLARQWRGRVFGSTAHGENRDSGLPQRRMPPLMGGASLTWEADSGGWWVEGLVLAAAEQDRLSDGDLGDARIGASRSASAIANFFNGTAVDRGLVRDGRLVATNETLAQVQARVLGGAASAPMFTTTAGYAVASLRAGVSLGRHVQVILIGENLTDRNYRIHGSGVDEPGVNGQIRVKVRF